MFLKHIKISFRFLNFENNISFFVNFLFASIVAYLLMYFLVCVFVHERKDPGARDG
jgi:hypothetical protein